MDDEIRDFERALNLILAILGALTVVMIGVAAWLVRLIVTR